MPEPRPDEFYVGYLPKSPPRLARHTRVVILVHLVLGMAAATLIVGGMRDPGRGEWDDATPKSFAGVLLKRPYPILLDASGHALLIVDFGKRGAQQRLAPLADGQRVTLRGYPLLRDGRTMIELAPDEDAVIRDSGIQAPPSIGAGERTTLRGEIVDSKCYLGAMKPGEGKTHKACATRCISGGIPPMLVAWDRQGHPRSYLLSDASGGPLADWILPLVGEPVELTGEVSAIGDLAVVRVGDQRITPR